MVVEVQIIETGPTEQFSGFCIIFKQLFIFKYYVYYISIKNDYENDMTIIVRLTFISFFCLVN